MIGASPWWTLACLATSSFRSSRRRYDALDIPMHRIHTVICTHSHPDHFGGAGRLVAKCGAEVLTHERFGWFTDAADDGADADPDQLTADGVEERSFRGSVGRSVPWAPTLYEPLNAEDRARMEARFDDPYFFPQVTIRVTEHDPVLLGGRRFVSLHTPGHTADHLCLFDPESGVLFSGDHVLPSITPHISGMHYGDDPLSAYFLSLRKVQHLDGVSVVLPAHGHPFTDVHGRVQEIVDHHYERLDRLVQGALELGRPGTVADFMRFLFHERSWGSMAESETYAHLEHLRLAGSATREFDEGWAHYDLTPADTVAANLPRSVR